jgi:hypothetical protein
LAYPDEPQRPVTSTEEQAATPAVVPPPPRGFASLALAAFAIAIVACLALYLAVSVPGSWFPGASTQAIGARSLTIARGSGALDGDALAVTGVDAGGIAVVSARTDVRSAQYPVVTWEGFGFAENADVRFLWQTDYAPNKLNSIAVPVVAGRLAPVTMSTNGDWIGRITGVALAIRGPLAEPVHVVGVSLKPGGIAGTLGDRLREWVAFERWSGTSINTITGGAEVQELPLPTLLMVAAALALAAWFAFAWRAHRTRAFPAALALVFVAAWVVLDALWSANLARQVAETRAQYGGKDWRGRHLAAEDAQLFAFVEKARAKLPEKPVRVFVVADAPYFRGRGAYHLYPHNVLFDPFSNSVPNPASLHSGDYLLVYHRRGLQYNAEQKKLKLEQGEPISAEAVLVEPGAALFRIS